MKNKTKFKYAFVVIVLLAGIILNSAGIKNEYLGFSSVGNWLIYIGLVMIAVISLQTISNKKRIVDERMEFIAYKASRITFVAIILAAFVVMILDGIKPITAPYHLLASYAIAYLIFIYFIAYKVLERYN